MPTRISLLSRLRDWEDRESWQEFFDIYWRLVYGTAKRAGLSDAEAQDVVQEVMLAASKGLPKFHYDRSKGTFKGWLVLVTKRKIADHYRGRPPWSRRPAPCDGPGVGADQFWVPVEELGGTSESDIDRYWEAEWKRTMVSAAMRRVRGMVSARQFQVFDLYVCQERSVKEVCDILKVTPVQVYLARNRVAKRVRAEIAVLEKETGEVVAR